MAPNASTTSLLDSLKAIGILKNMILDQVRAVHGRSYPTSHYTFSVTTSTFDYGTNLAPRIRYGAQAIVYTTPGSLAEWKLLAEAVYCQSRQEAIEELYCETERQVNEITEHMGEDDVWNEAVAKEKEKEAEKENAA